MAGGEKRELTWLEVDMVVSTVHVSLGREVANLVRAKLEAKP